MKIPHLPFWKKTSLAWCLGMILHFSSFAQCTGNMATRSYDTILTGIGYGDYLVSFPKWNPDSGFLAAVKINARVSVYYGFTLKNVDAVPSIYSLWVGREDRFSSPSMSTPYDSITEQKIGVFPLMPGGVLTQPPFTFLYNYDNTDSISTTPLFLGSDSIHFAYSPITYTTLHTNNNSSYSYNAAAFDTVHFSLTYFYCKKADPDTLTNVPAPGGMSVYPNPAVDFVDLVFGQGSPTGWQVQLFTADGRTVQSGDYLQPDHVHVDFLQRAPAGVYFIRASDREGRNSFTRMILRR